MKNDVSCDTLLGNPCHVGKNYLIKTFSNFLDMDSDKLPNFNISILREMIEEELVKMEEEAKIFRNKNLVLGSFGCFIRYQTQKQFFFQDIMKKLDFESDVKEIPQ